MNHANNAFSTRFAPPSEAVRSARLSTLEVVQETPQRDIRSVSVLLKATDETPVKTVLDHPSTPSSLPSLPPSPFQSIISRIPAPSVVLSAIQGQGQVAQQQEVILQSSTDLLHSLRIFLSNSRNIWSLSVILELFSVLYTIISWERYSISVAGKTVSFTYAPLETATTSYFWTVLLHWSIPSLIVPAIVGSLISFSHRPRPQELVSTSSGPPVSPPSAPFDPLSASISRLAIQWAYPFANLSAAQGRNVDPLGSNLRIWSASVSVAFAFAEAISGAPEVVVREVLRETQKRRTISYHEEDDDLSVVGSPRKQITTGEDEVD